MSFSEWLNDFFTSYYKNRPVNATFIGVHKYDDYMPDFSNEGVTRLKSEMENLLARLKTIESSRPLESRERVDCLLAANFLEIQLAELRSHHFHQGNPSLYTGEAVFGIISLFLRDFAPPVARVRSAISRLKATPRLLQQGMSNVHSAPKEWTERAIQECTGAACFLGKGIEQLTQSLEVNSSSLRSATQVALTAFQEYKEYLSEELMQHPNNSYACGRQFYEMLIQKGHCLSMNGNEVSEYGMRKLRTRHERLVYETSSFRKDGDVKKILAGLQDSRPSLEEYLQSFHRLWADSVRVANEHNLLTWPNLSLRYTFVPSYFREAAPYLYFLWYRAPPPFDPPSTYYYLVTPVEASMPLDEQERRLRSMNYSAIKSNHVVHHGSIGHHLQNYHAYRAASRIGQIAAVDCASRIAMFCGGTMAEGWACYATDIMLNTGFFNHLEQFSHLNSQLRQAAQTVVDSKLHSEEFTFEEACRFYVNEAGMSPEAARGQVTFASMFPGTAAMYLLGNDSIHKLREELLRKESASDLATFHDRFLKYGSIPVSLIASDMLGRSFSLLS